MIGKMSIDVKRLLAGGVARVDAALATLLPPSEQQPVSIHQAMRHSTFAGGKRLRPVLCMEAGRMLRHDGQYPEGIEELAAALEMLHTYSLIHDDLPALDNDDLRRGNPTCHVVFGEAIAILAGDALQTQAYQVLSALRCEPQVVVAIIRLIAQATGTVDGMIGGQVMDIESEKEAPTHDLVHAIHRAKTGALIRVSIVTGGLYGGASAMDTQHLTKFGQDAGLAFQIVDDVLDVTQASSHLGKTAGKDVASVKATWPAVYGIEKSLEHARGLIASAFAALEPYGSKADSLKALATYVVERTH
jgi:geranylgeranyl diphosphate synthase type II